MRGMLELPILGPGKAHRECGFPLSHASSANKLRRPMNMTGPNISVLLLAVFAGFWAHSVQAQATWHREPFSNGALGEDGPAILQEWEGEPAVLFTRSSLARIGTFDVFFAK